jgi:hypothetical protein
MRLTARAEQGSTNLKQCAPVGAHSSNTFWCFYYVVYGQALSTYTHRRLVRCLETPSSLPELKTHTFESILTHHQIPFIGTPTQRSPWGSVLLLLGCAPWRCGPVLFVINCRTHTCTHKSENKGLAHAPRASLCVSRLPILHTPMRNPTSARTTLSQHDPEKSLLCSFRTYMKMPKETRGAAKGPRPSELRLSQHTNHKGIRDWELLVAALRGVLLHRNWGFSNLV